MDQSKDLLNRVQIFAEHTREFIRRIPKTIASMGDCRRLIRSSGIIGSSYINADYTSNREDFLQQISDCCLAAKQSQHWARLLGANLDERCEQLQQDLIQEAAELEKIFKSVLQKRPRN